MSGFLFSKQEKESQAPTTQNIKVVGISADNITHRVVWKIEKFSSLGTERHFSDVFIVRGCKWRLVILPNGGKAGHLSVFLYVADGDSLPMGWRRYTELCFCIINQTNLERTIRKYEVHDFMHGERDYDIVTFTSFGRLRNGHIINDTIVVEVEMYVPYVAHCLTDCTENETMLKNDMEVGQLREVSKKTPNTELKLFLEVELGPALCPILPPEKMKEDILLFFKFYDPEKEELHYVGRLSVKSSGNPIEMLTRLNVMAGLPPNEEIELYEYIDKEFAFRVSQLEDGDIICFQKTLSAENDKCIRYPDVPSFLDYVHNPQVVHFRSLERPKEDGFCLELLKLYTYDDVVERVARQLSLDDPTKIRLTSHNSLSRQPKPQPIKYRGVECLLDMLVHYNKVAHSLFAQGSHLMDSFLLFIICCMRLPIEILDIPLPELQGLKTPKVAFHHSTKDEVVIHSIRLPKQSTVGDVINDLKTKVELSNPNAELRLLEIFYHKIYKIFPLHEKCENINDHGTKVKNKNELYGLIHGNFVAHALHACKLKLFIPEEEKNLGPHDRLIHVYHFTKDTTQNQTYTDGGVPLILAIREGEMLAEVKVRIQKKLQVPDEEFSKQWNFTSLSLGRPEYLQDSDVVLTHFQRSGFYGAWEQYDSATKRFCTANQTDRAHELLLQDKNAEMEEVKNKIKACEQELAMKDEVEH
ncbi:hypothetical protein AMTRI_Chr03g56220 [Amborella trichopoda]